MKGDLEKVKEQNEKRNPAQIGPVAVQSVFSGPLPHPQIIE
ncbi:MAG: hypothetical protein U9N14_04750 [Pseudomonadota bacterium]|nr:hypothetical protein [Pseudomonadota bacterium]